VGRNAERLEAAATELRATGRRVLPVSADVREPEAVERALDRAITELGGADIIVNGAAGNFLCPASQLSYNGFRTVMAIDTLGTFNVCRAAFDKWLRDHGGHIINISATLHHTATPLQIHASAAKAAVDAITRSLALEWGGLGIRVNGIAPGPIADTVGMSKLAPGDATAQLERRIPIQRFGRIDEIGSVALFLCTDAASLIHGTTIVADGGAVLTGLPLDL
jgi:peroxisomal 2,4-dienoyl-CoA reductase